MLRRVLWQCCARPRVVAILPRADTALRGVARWPRPRAPRCARANCRWCARWAASTSPSPARRCAAAPWSPVVASWLVGRGERPGPSAAPAEPTVSKQVKSASLEAARSSPRGGWRGTRWLGLTLGVPRCPEPPGAPRGAAGGELGHCEGGTWTVVPRQARPGSGPSGTEGLSEGALRLA